MNITKNHIRVLKEVQEKLVSKNSFYICHSLDDIAEAKNHLREECFDLQDWVKRQLGQHYAYGSWLISSYPWIILTDEQERAGRIAWVEHMIKILDYKLNKLKP